MKWNGLLAERAALMPRSTVREFLKHAARPGVISFAGGLPAPELFPLEAAAAAADRALTRHGAKAMQYGQTEGIVELREYLAARFGTKLEDVLITCGGQQALDVIGRVLLNPGERVLVENPTYLSLLSAWRPLGVSFHALNIEEVHDTRALAPKLLYCMPNFQNPTGLSLSLEERERLASSGLPLVEDDAYGELRYEGERLPGLRELAPERTIFVGTFSKVLAPGLRVGWIVAPGELMDVLVRAKQGMDLQTGTFNQYVAWEMISAGVIEVQLPALRREYKLRRDAMLAALAEELPSSVSWTNPSGGMFLFVRLLEGENARELARRALEADVLIVPGEDFHVSGGQNTFRMNFSNASIELIREGVRRLGRLLKGTTA